MIIKATMMAIGLALTILELQVQQPDGVVLMIAGVLFGMGLHWYKRSWSWRTFAVGALVAMGNPVAVGAITRGEPPPGTGRCACTRRLHEHRELQRLRPL